MARNTSTALKTHLEGENTTLATCWKITRTDSTTMGFTDHLNDITFDGQVFEASAGFQPTDVLQRDNLSVDNMDVLGILDSNYITEEDIQAGVYDFAEIEIFMVNYEDPSQGRMWVKRGWIGEVRLTRGQFEAEIRGLAQKFSQHIGRIFSPSCDAVFGDARCGLNELDFSGPATVTTVTDSQVFATSAVVGSESYFKAGQILWVTGANAGLRMEIKEFGTSGIMTLVLPMAKLVQTGDTFTAIAGCDKSKATCRDKFSNLVNFRGFPDLPGQDKMLETSGTFTESEE